MDQYLRHGSILKTILKTLDNIEENIEDNIEDINIEDMDQYWITTTAEHWFGLVWVAHLGL